jgi:hypothetical protein
MTENTDITVPVELTEGQIDLLTGEEVTIESDTEEVTVEDIVKALVDTIPEPITAYKIATVINKTFEVLQVAKTIPTQMMYNYTLKGMIVKGKKGSAKDIRYTQDEVTAFATKYVKKYI